MSVETRSIMLHVPEITRDFLESQLGQKIESFTVEKGSQLGDNYMSELYSITVQTLHSTDDPSPFSKEMVLHYLLKCYPSHPSRQKFLNKANHFHHELCFYMVLAKDLMQFQTEVGNIRPEEVIPLAIPRIHGGKAVNFAEKSVSGESTDDPEKVYGQLDNFILMTDMRKELAYQMTDPRKGLDADHVILAFTELATLHALSWVYRKTVEWDVVGKYPFLKRLAKTRKTDMWMGLLQENVKTAIAAIDLVKGKGNVISKAVQNFCENGKTVLDYFFSQDHTDEMKLQKLLKKYKQTCQDNGHWRVVCHGDCWSNNMLFKYNTETGKPQHVVLVDFALVKFGCPTLDLACLVYTSTRSYFRHHHLQKCLQVYLDRFCGVCDKMKVQYPDGFNLEALENRFQMSKLVGLLIALISLPLNLADKDSGGNMEETNPNASMGEMLQETCTSAVKASSTLYQEWVVELVEDLYNDGVI